MSKKKPHHTDHSHYQPQAQNSAKSKGNYVEKDAAETKKFFIIAAVVTVLLVVLLFFVFVN